MKLLNCKCADSCRAWAPLALRVAVGVVFFAHGWQKFSAFGAEQVGGFFESAGIPLPYFFAWVVMLLETIGGAALVLGLFVHWFSKLFAIEMVGAFFWVHMKGGLFLPDGFEYVLVLFVVSVALMISGGGKWALDSLLWKRGAPHAPNLP